MQYLSTFSGIGGFELGIQAAIPDAECVGFCEIDKYATEVYQRNFPGTHNYADITTINPSELPDFDCLVGGFPCQAFSIAGNRRGFSETRGTLFFDVARILRDKRPRHLVLENVKGLLSHDGGQTFQTILGVLTDLGYRVEWQVLNSKDFGVPQNRERVYIVGHLGACCGREVFPISEVAGQPSGARHKAGAGIANALRAKSGGPDLEETWIATGVGNRGRANGAQWEARSDGLANTVRTAGGRGSTPHIAIGYKGHTANTPDSIAKTVKAGVHGMPGGEGLLDDGVRIRRLTPIETERLQGFPDNWTAGFSDTQRYKMCGNAVTTNVVQAVFARLAA